MDKLVLFLAIVLSGCGPIIYTPPEQRSYYPKEEHYAQRPPDHGWNNRRHDNDWDSRDRNNERGSRNQRRNDNRPTPRGKTISITVVDKFGRHDRPYFNPEMKDNLVRQDDYTNDLLYLLREALEAKGYSLAERAPVELEVQPMNFSLSSFGSRTNAKVSLYVKAHNNQGKRFQHTYNAHHKDSGPHRDEVIEQTFADAVNELMRDPEFLAIIVDDNKAVPFGVKN